DCRAAAGGLVRDCEGRLVVSYAANLGSCSIMRAELRGIIDGMRLAWDKVIMLGEWMNKSAGPHVIRILAEERGILTHAFCLLQDIVAKILSFTQHRPRSVCVLSRTATASSVTLRQPASAGPTATYEGRFEILCLPDSYLVA
ncbi:AT-hook motif nuclear-localized protein 5, partial [Linum perenne]